MAWQRYDAEQQAWITIPDEFAGGENDRFVADSFSTYSGAGEHSKLFAQANDFGNTAFYGYPGSVGLMLADAARRAGVPDYDFNAAAWRAAPGFGWALPGASGWQLGANEEQIYRAILQNTDNAALQSLANERNQGAYNAGAAAGVQRDVELAIQNAKTDNTLATVLTIAAVVGAAITAGASLGIGAATAGEGISAATLAGDIGGLAFPVDAVTTAAQWGTVTAAADVATLAGDIGGAAFPVDSYTIAQQWGSAVTAADAATLAGDIGGNAFPVDQATTAGQWGTYVAPSFSVPQIIQDTGKKLLSAVTGTVGASLASSLLGNAQAAELGADQPSTLPVQSSGAISGAIKIAAGVALAGALLAVLVKGKK